MLNEPRRTAPLLALLVVVAAALAGGFLLTTDDAAPQRDARPSASKPSQAAVPERPQARAARNRLQRRLGPAAVAKHDKQTGGVRLLADLDGYLTGRSAKAPADRVLNYVRDHESAIGLDGDDLRGLELVEKERRGPLVHLRWRQERRGVPFHDGELRAAVRTDGRIVNVIGGARADLDAAKVPAQPQLDAAAARASAAKATGDQRPAPATRTAERTGDRRTVFANGDQASLVLTGATGDLRLAWRTIRRQSHDEVYDQLVDAQTGAELERKNRVVHAAQGIAVERYPGAPKGGNEAPVDFAPFLTPGATQLTGPRGRVYSDVNGDNTQNPGEEVAPTNGDWAYLRSPFRLRGCPAVGCSWQPGAANTWQTNRKQAATQVFAFMAAFQRHLAAEPIGFDAFHGDDPMVAETHDGAAMKNGLPDEDHLNNADMMVWPEGQSPVMQVYLYGNGTNGADEGELVFHEYGHALIGRKVTLNGWSALDDRQAAALNEGLADFFAADYVVGRGLHDDDPGVNGELVLGLHTQPDGGFRSMATDCAVGSDAPNCAGDELTGNGGYTYGDYGWIDDDGPEPHADGEILTQTMWDLRASLIAQHGSTEGLRRLRRIAVEALALSPPQPSFLDYRNAVVQADRALHGGVDVDRIWDVFAKRGMGWGAGAIDADDVKPSQSFELPPTQAGVTLRGTVRQEGTGVPQPAFLHLAGHNSDDDWQDYYSGTSSTGQYALQGVRPGTYRKMVVTANGHERVVLKDVKVGPGETTLDVTTRRNWAYDAEVLRARPNDGGSSSGCGPGNLLDGDHKSGWTFPTIGGGEAAGTVELKLAEDVRLTSVAVNPTPRCYGSVPSRVTVEAAPRRGSAWKNVAELALDPSSSDEISELRPAAPMEDVRRVRVTVYAGENEGYLSLSELQIYASRQHAPRAAFSHTPRMPDVDEEITFDASGSRAGSAAIVDHRWDLDGDGSYETASGATKTVKHTFDTSGRHRVRLKVTGADGQVDEVGNTVLVGTGAEIFDLGTLRADDSGRARAIFTTDGGELVGTTGTNQVAANDPLKAWRYRGGDMVELPGVAAGGWAVPYATNEAGRTVGASAPTVGGNQRAVLWNGGDPIDLGTFGGPQASAIGINASGTIVGFADGPGGNHRPFVKHPGTPLLDAEVQAGVPAERRRPSKLVKISDAGIAVGCRGYSLSFQTCDKPLRYDTVTQTLTELPMIGNTGGVADIDEAGVSVGAVFDMTNTAKAARWSAAGELEVLGTLSGGHTQLIASNDTGTAVGETEAFGANRRAIRWTRAGGLEDLNRYVRGSGWTLVTAEGVNDRDEVVGTGMKDGVMRAFQLNLGPCRVCVEDVQVLERNVESDEWQPAGADGVVDGNLVRLRVTLRNDELKTHLTRVRITDENRDEEAGNPQDPTMVTLPAGATKVVDVDWETEGRAWTQDGKPDADHVLRVRATLGHTVFSSRGLAVKVRPKPVVLVHGVLANAGVWEGWDGFVHRAHPDWRAYAVGDGRAPGILDTGSWNKLDEAPKTIAENAEIVGNYVRGVRGAENAERVDVVAHSVGGLIARRYVHHHMPVGTGGGDVDPPLNHLVLLGTPNLGTPCAELTGLDGQQELRRDSVAQFNREVSDRRGVRFSAVAGVAEPATCRGSEEGDGFVPASSAVAGVADHERLPLWSGDMPGSGSVFTGFVLDRLNGRVAVEAEAGAPGRAALAVADDAPTAPPTHDFLERSVVAVAAGGTADVPVELDSGGGLGVQLHAPPEVRAELVAPDGTVAAASAAATRQSGSPFRSLSVARPDAGAWIVRLRNEGNEPTKAQVVAQLDDDRWALDLVTGPGATGGQLAALATVSREGSRVPGATVALELRRRGAAAVTATLHDDGAHADGAAGDGCYGASLDGVTPGAAVGLLSARAAGVVRLREVRLDVPAPGGEPARLVCPARAGGNGAITYNESDAKTQRWSAVQPAGSGASAPAVHQGIDEIDYSPDGQRLAYSSGSNVYVAKADGSERETVIGGDSVSRRDVAWSRDGRKLAYSMHCAGKKTCAIGILDLESRSERELESTVAVGGREPTWSPDGRRIAFVGDVDDACESDVCPEAQDVFAVSEDGSDLQRLTRRAMQADEPAWSPDGSRIAFQMVDQYFPEQGHLTDVEIYAVAPDGTQLENLTDDEDCDRDDSFALAECPRDRHDSAPEWSPDGRRIAYVSTQDAVAPGAIRRWRSELWTMRADGAGARRVTDADTSKRSPAWVARPLTVEPVAPECDDMSARTRRGTAVRLALACSDANGDPLTLRIVDGPQHGTLSAIDGAGTVTYSPAAGFEGTDTFRYTAGDGTGEAPVATATVEVTPPPPPPPPPAPEPPAPRPGTGGGSGGGSGHGGGGGGSQDDRPAPRPGPRPQLPPNCTVDPRTGMCIIGVPCAPGGDISGCTVGLRQSPPRKARGAAKATAAAARKKLARSLIRPVQLQVPAGSVARVQVRLTPAARKQLKRRGRLVVPLRLEVRAGGRLLSSTTRSVVFRARGR